MSLDLTIPQIRERLFELADELGAPELADLAEQTRRRYHGRKAPTQAFKITAQVRAAVKAYARENPKMHMRHIAQVFKIDQGRVSEILFGKRGEA